MRDLFSSVASDWGVAPEKLEKPISELSPEEAFAKGKSDGRKLLQAIAHTGYNARIDYLNGIECHPPMYNKHWRKYWQIGWEECIADEKTWDISACPDRFRLIPEKIEDVGETYGCCE